MLNMEFKPISIINVLRKKYGGVWRYDRKGGRWEREGGGTARYVANLGGYAGDEYTGSTLMYYPPKDGGRAECVF